MKKGGADLQVGKEDIRRAFALLRVNTRDNVRPMARALQSFAAHKQSIYGVY